ncbi:hypothetical protein GCM10018954_031940 [Kutzneria kofuensis]
MLGPGGFITKPRGQMHAMWNATDKPGRILEVIAPGGFESYFRELGELLVTVRPPAGTALHETADSPRAGFPLRPHVRQPRVARRHRRRYGLTPPKH